MPAFTDRYIRALPAPGITKRIYEGASDPGFCIQLTPAGSKTFQLQYSYLGRTRFFRLGSYPATSLAEARARCREARRLLEAGQDPQEIRRREKLERSYHGSVRQLADVYLAQMEARGRRSTQKARLMLEKNVFPVIGDMPAREVRPEHVREILYRVIHRGAEVQSNRLRKLLRSVFRCGQYHDYDPRALGAEVLFGIEANPVDAVPGNRYAESVGERALEWKEIVQLWRDERLPEPQRLALRLILSTGGQRPGEITRAAWEEFDLEARVWTLPAARSKNYREHLIPLTELALTDLARLTEIYPGSPWLFPGRHDPAAPRPWSSPLLSETVRRYLKASGMTPWVARDLRRTWKTRAGELGISKEIRDRVQNHLLSDISTKHYDRYQYLTEKRAALEAFSAHLRGLLAGANVVGIKGR